MGGLGYFRQDVMAADYVLDISFGEAITISGIALRKSEGDQYLTINYDGFSIRTKGPTAVYTLPVDHKVSMQVSYVDAHGNPAAVDGPVAWAASDASLATVTADAADSTICTVVPAGPVGQVQGSASADGDLGTGVKQLVTTADISLVAGEAVSGTIQPTGPAVPVA